MWSLVFSHLNRLVIPVMLILTGCAAPQEIPTRTADARWQGSHSFYGPYAIDDADLDLGDNWDRGQLRPAQPTQRSAPTAATPTTRQPASSAPSTTPQQRASAPSPRPTQRDPAPTTPSAPAASAEPQPTWSIVLQTFSGQGHAEASKAMLANLGAAVPELAGGAFTRATDRGSMVLFGRYQGPDDPRARADLDRIKSMSVNNTPAFPRAFLTLIRPQTRPQADHPNALLSARKRHPNVHPLYTLQVASWSDFDTGQLSPQEIRKRAETYAQELRSKGHEAYFHHDDRTRISIVTVGILGQDAIDLQSGVESAQLRQLRRQFPVHLVNGEPLHELIDRNDPKKGTRAQSPRLVLVPRP